MEFLEPEAKSFVQSTLTEYDGSLGPAATVRLPFSLTPSFVHDMPILGYFKLVGGRNQVTTQTLRLGQFLALCRRSRYTQHCLIFLPPLTLIRAHSSDRQPSREV